jgi:transcriptional regulator with XRE-family HTH domain
MIYNISKYNKLLAKVITTMDYKHTKHIIDNIKERRLALGYSYQDLANKTGMNKSTLQRYETGSIRNLSIDNLEVLAKALDIDPAYLMGWEDSPSNLKRMAANDPSEASNTFEQNFLLVDPYDLAYRRRFATGYIDKAADIVIPYLAKKGYVVEFIEWNHLGRIIATKDNFVRHFDFYLPSADISDLEIEGKLLIPSYPPFVQLFSNVPLYNESINQYTIVVNNESLLESILKRRPKTISIKASIMLIDLEKHLILKEVPF